jgi:hypothetical protein
MPRIYPIPEQTIPLSEKVVKKDLIPEYTIPFLAFYVIVIQPCIFLRILCVVINYNTHKHVRKSNKNE